MARPGLGLLALVLLATGCTVGRMVRDEDSCHQASQALSSSSHGNNLHTVLQMQSISIDIFNSEQTWFLKPHYAVTINHHCNKCKSLSRILS